MKEGPDISIVAALIGNPACANMLTALLSGPALTATELAQEAGLTPSTVSGYLARLESAGLVAIERQGRQRLGAAGLSRSTHFMAVEARGGRRRLEFIPVGRLLEVWAAGIRLTLRRQELGETPTGVHVLAEPGDEQVLELVAIRERPAFENDASYSGYKTETSTFAIGHDIGFASSNVHGAVVTEILT